MTKASKTPVKNPQTRAAAAKRYKTVITLVDQNAGVDEICELLGDTPSALINFAYRYKFKIPARNKCRPFKASSSVPVLEDSNTSPTKCGDTLACTAKAIVSQVKMFQLLTDHFDPDLGAYLSKDWDDGRIAKATELSLQYVIRFRDIGFGPIKKTREVLDLEDKLAAATKLVEQINAQLKKLSC